MSYGLKNIAKDLITGKVMLTEAELSAERLKMCESCTHFTKLSRQCNLCGCFMDMKVKLIRASCPAEKW